MNMVKGLIFLNEICRNFGTLGGCLDTLASCLWYWHWYWYFGFVGGSPEDLEHFGFSSIFGQRRPFSLEDVLISRALSVDS